MGRIIPQRGKNVEKDDGEGVKKKNGAVIVGRGNVKGGEKTNGWIKLLKSGEKKRNQKHRK